MKCPSAGSPVSGTPSVGGTVNDLNFSDPIMRETKLAEDFWTSRSGHQVANVIQRLADFVRIDRIHSVGCGHNSVSGTDKSSRRL